MILRAKIPLRISFSGGGTDVDPFCNQFGGNIISSAISKYVYASLEERRDDKIKIVSLDYNKTIKFNIKKEIALRGNLKLIKAIVNFFKPYRKGFNFLPVSTNWVARNEGEKSNVIINYLSFFEILIYYVFNYDFYSNNNN